ncbi:MAG: hypothetical protein H0X24_09160 [Ktedonobacterales bacterium]|nr:hypothetical protein [Ktedonobacterales bacterium]
MTTLTVEDANQSHARTARRRVTFHPAWHVVATILVAFGSGVGATATTRWLLRDTRPSATVSHPPPAPLVVVHDGVTLGGGSPLAVGMGATQSYAGLAITVDQLRIAPTNDFVGAPPDSHIAIMTVTLVNTDPVRPLPYNAAEFWLTNPAGDAHHEVFAASAQPLGAGQVAPHSQFVGELAFFVTATPDVTAPDPQIVFAPTAAPAFTLRWDLPLVSALP